MVEMMIRIALATVALLSPSLAQAFCYEPPAPACAQGWTAFADSFDADQCRREVERFEEESTEFGRCQILEMEQKIREKAGEVEMTIMSFNRRLSM
jgi:hypothetical protein